ncbi:MAG: hypothetical protein SFV54_02700 [Bryobacteraceae bacterium]|nr:hypothetical protein [Bryobacteraceae bacterium]
MTAFVLASAMATWAQTEQHGLPARASAADYQSQAAAGKVTIAAEFTGHAVPNDQGPLQIEDFVVVEVALYGASGERLVIAATDFSLRIGGRKAPLPSQPWGLAAKNVKDPEWAPPEAAGEGKPKGGGLTTGGGGGNQRQPGEPPPLPPKPPIELLRSWQQRLRKAALPEGDRALPQAGLLFFPYSGKDESIRSAELVYEGPAGKATVTLR